VALLLEAVVSAKQTTRGMVWHPAKPFALPRNANDGRG